MHHTLGFLGAGNMAEAIARAAIHSGVLTPEQMFASDPSDERRHAFSHLGIHIATDNGHLITRSGQIMVAVKPQMLLQAAAELAHHGARDHVILSIMAGISTGKLATAIAEAGGDLRHRIVRIMPNTPLQVGHGMAGICLGEHARPGDEELALQLFQATGKAVVVDESLMDAITAVSGSGPAYAFYLAEAMQQAAEDLGLGEHATLFVRQTLLGAAHLLSESHDNATTLRKKVTSPGGTTEAALKHLDKHHTKHAIIDAVKAAAHRSLELGR